MPKNGASRKQAGLLASESIARTTAFPVLPSGVSAGATPVTVAGPPGILTRFPILPVGHLLRNVFNFP